MPDSIYQFGCTFAVVKSEKFQLTDMEFAQAVLYAMKARLGSGHSPQFHFVIESIHPIMVGPEGGTPVEDGE